MKKSILTLPKKKYGLYEVLQKKIYLEEYGKRKLFKKIKRKHTIHDMKSMQEKINGDIEGPKFKSI